MQVTKVKYALWAADWQRCLPFYRDLFSGEVTMDPEGNEFMMTQKRR
jgi:predicted enzyme related to lactoylglutathione lyase